MDRQPVPRGVQPWLPLAGGILLGAALGLIVFFGIPSRPSAQPPPQSIRPPSLAGIELGGPAPEFELFTPNGQSIALGSLQGNAVVLSFWATWCAPCRIEMPLLQTASDAHAAEGLVVLGINFDETAEEVMAFGEALNLQFPLLLDPGGEVQNLYRIRGYPTTVIIDRTGTIAAYHIGILSATQLDDYLAQVGIGQ